MNDEPASSSNPSGVQGICPTGWHVPSDDEWKQLEMYLGMSQSDADNTTWRGTDEGGKLKETGTDHWMAPNYGATNVSGFTALPGGHRYGNEFNDVGGGGYWHTCTLSGNSYAYRSMGDDHSDIYRAYGIYKAMGQSLRCVKD